MSIKKIISVLLVVTLMFSSISSINVVFAEENSPSVDNAVIEIVENSDDEITLQATIEEENAVVQTTFDKESNEFLIISNEPNENGEMIEKTYRAIVEHATEDEIVATFIDTTTGETFNVNSNEFQASLAWFVPLGVVLGEALLAHLVASGTAFVLAGVTYTAVKEVSDKLKKKEHNHYMAKITKGDLFIGNPLTKSQAIDRLQSNDKKNNNVWSKNYDLAAKIAYGAGNNKTPVGPEIDKGKTSAEGYYFHFHIHNRSGGHSFYY